MRDDRDGAVIALLKSSAAVQAIERAIETVVRAASASTARGLLVDTATAWSLLPWPRRRLLTGAVLLAASAVPLAAAAWRSPAGWLWLVVPGIAAAGGVLCLLTSRPPAPGPTTR